MSQPIDPRRRITKAIVAIPVLVVLAFSLGCTNTSGGADSKSDSSTKIVVVQPWTEAGVADNYKATTEAGMCWSASELVFRADSYRCQAGNSIHDPCFSSPYPTSSSKVACPTSPTDVMIIELTEPLPAQFDGAKRPEEGQVWMIILEDDTQCKRWSGAGPDLVDGLAASMACNNTAGRIVWGEPDTSAAVWTIKTSTNEHGPLTTSRIKEAYR